MARDLWVSVDDACALNLRDCVRVSRSGRWMWLHFRGWLLARCVSFRTEDECQRSFTALMSALRDVVSLPPPRRL
jgi:hypothetical protein